MKLKRLFAGFLILVMCVTCVGMKPVNTQAAQKEYWIKVNYQRNVATVYEKKNGEWKPIKAMLTSCGTNTPKKGTYKTLKKYRWHYLMGPSYGQYCTRIVRSILFHSVWYYENKNKQSQSVKQFNKLGTTASHGCVRLSTIDAKWVYDNCKLATKVTFYKSSNPGPLGKPAAYKMPSGYMNWDPTDPDPKNPYNKTLPVLEKKKALVDIGSDATVRSLVTAKHKNGTKLSHLCYDVKKWNADKEKYVDASFSTKKAATYKIKYHARSNMGVSITKTFKFRVCDLNKPVIKASDRTVAINSTNAVKGMTAKMDCGIYRTKKVKTYIKTPGAESYGKAISYDNAKEYKFSKKGVYTIKYVATNKNDTSIKSTKVIKVTVKTPTITRSQKEVYYGRGESVSADTLKALVTAKDYDGTALDVTMTGYEDIDFNTAGEYTVTYKATGTNNYSVKTTVKVVISDVTFVKASEESPEVADGMILDVPAYDEAAIIAQIESYGEFQYRGEKVTPVYTFDAEAKTCVLTFAEAPATKITIQLNVAE